MDFVSSVRQILPSMQTSSRSWENCSQRSMQYSWPDEDMREQRRVLHDSRQKLWMVTMAACSDRSSWPMCSFLSPVLFQASTRHINIKIPPRKRAAATVGYEMMSGKPLELCHKKTFGRPLRGHGIDPLNMTLSCTT